MTSMAPSALRAACVVSLLGALGAPGWCAAGSVEGSLQVTSDYVFRGLSQTAGEPALQAGIQYRTANNAFVGAWGSTIGPDPGAGRGVELDLYLGRAWRVEPWLDARLTVVRYMYPRDPADRHYDYTEVIGALDLGDRATLTLAWSPDMAAYSSWSGVERDHTTSAELALRQPLGSHASLFGSAGYQDVRSLYGEAYWSFAGGVAWNAGPWSLSLGRFVTSDFARGWFGDEVAGPRWAGTVSWRFHQ
jgi:uncharacterized protein (TIGR02001 family)